MPKTFAVIGLGRFGSQIARALIEKGFEVIIIDQNEEKINEFAESAAGAFVMDATDEKALRDAGIGDVDCAIVSVGQNISSSILITMLLKELGVKEIIVKEIIPIHGKILEKLGATKIINPEKDTALRLASSFTSPRIFDIIEVSPEYSVVEVVAPKEFWNRPLRDIHLRRDYRVSVIAIRRKKVFFSENGVPDFKEEVIIGPGADDEVLENDILVLLGKYEDLERVSKLWKRRMRKNQKKNIFVNF